MLPFVLGQNFPTMLILNYLAFFLLFGGFNSMFYIKTYNSDDSKTEVNWKSEAGISGTDFVKQEKDPFFLTMRDLQPVLQTKTNFSEKTASFGFISQRPP